MPVELDLSGPEKKLRDLGRALRSAEDGKDLRRELLKNIRAAAGPARQAARASIRSLHSAGHPGRSIRSAIAQKVQVVAKTSGKTVGARIVANTTPGVRGFRHAPRRFNSARGWFHPEFDGTEVHQVGKPGWFDDPIQKYKPEYRRAVVDAINTTANKIARKVR